jgi:hypothetical protein
MLAEDRQRLVEVSSMLVGKSTAMPTAADVALVEKTSPKFAGPIFAEALVGVAKDGSLNATHVSTLVNELFMRITKPIKGMVCKQMQTLTLVRAAATPGDAAFVNWARAVAAAEFCIGTCNVCHEHPPDTKSDAIWRLLGASQCTSAAGASGRQRRVNWYTMMVRMAVTYTQPGEWSEAHAAMRKNADLVPEVVAQIKAMERAKSISAATLAAARKQMCLPPIAECKKTQIAGVDTDPLSFDFDGEFLDDAMALHTTVADDQVIDIPDDLVVAIAAFDAAPNTPPKKGRPRKSKPESTAVLSPVTPQGVTKSRAPARTLDAAATAAAVQQTMTGYFNVVMNRGGLTPPIDLVSGKKPPWAARRGVSRRPSKQLVGMAVCQAAGSECSLLCDESSEELAKETINWSSHTSCPRRSFIIAPHFVKPASMYTASWSLGTSAICGAVSLEQALGRA